MTVVLVSDPAESDLQVIIDYLDIHVGADVAFRYAQKLNHAVDHLVQHPQIGSPRRGRDHKIRQLLVAPYIVFYDFEAKTDLVRILRVLHQRRSISDEMLEG